MTTILLPAGCQHVSYIELAELMAKALNKGEDSQALAAYFIAEKKLPDAVRRGELLVRSGFSHAPLSTAPMVDAHGNDSSIILLDDLRDFLKGWGIAVEVEQPAQVARPAPAAQVEPVQAAPASHSKESQEQRQERRYKMCIDAGLKMPDNDYATLPRGIGDLATREGIKRQSFSEDVKAHIRRLNGR